MEVTENDQDVVILRIGRYQTYHFAHVVDVHLMGRRSLCAAGGSQPCQYTCSCFVLWDGRPSTRTPHS